MEINRKELFSKYNDVCIRKQKDGTYICYECKLLSGNAARDINDITISNVSNAKYHIQAHINDGHKLWPFAIKGINLAKKIEDECVTTVKIHYAITNNGDGSASCRWFKTEEDAKKFDAYEQEHYDGWGEPEFFTETCHFDKDGIMIEAETFEEAMEE